MGYSFVRISTYGYQKNKSFTGHTRKIQVKSYLRISLFINSSSQGLTGGDRESAVLRTFLIRLTQALKGKI